MGCTLFVNDSPVLLRESPVSSEWEDKIHYVYLDGFVFINGIPSGKESIIDFINKMSNSRIEDASRYLKGIFFIIVKNKKTNDMYFFVDNSGLFQAFYNSRKISNSFLQLIKHGYKLAKLTKSL